MSAASQRRFLQVFALVGLASLVGCTPEIGDKCRISTDCSIQGDRLCDLSQPDGYCTQLNCQRNSCADEASCVLFGAALPGCGFDDRSGPFGSRVARSFCMAKCESNSDCRKGYVCADPRTPPWSALILDDDQGKRSCLTAPLSDLDGGAPSTDDRASVCSAVAPPESVSRIDASAPAIQDGGSVPPLFPDEGTPPDAGDGG